MAEAECVDGDPDPATKRMEGEERPEEDGGWWGCGGHRGEKLGFRDGGLII